MREPIGPRAEKERGRGASKIERGLEFRVYRAAPNRRLLHVEPGRLRSDAHVSERILNRSLFFTTQKNMALEYTAATKPVLLEQRGVEFLEDARKLEADGLKMILFSHDDLAKWNPINNGKVPDAQAEAFLTAHTFAPSAVSPRRLRRAAEIVVLLPEGMNVLPLKQNTLKRRGSEGLWEEDRHRLRFGSGGFHRAVEKSNREPDTELRRLRKEAEALDKERTEAVVKAWRLRDDPAEEGRLKMLVKKLEYRLDAVKRTMTARRIKHGDE